MNLQIIENLPPYALWLTISLLAAYVLSIAIICGGSLVKTGMHCMPPGPRSGSSFPNVWDGLLCIFFLGLCASNAIRSLSDIVADTRGTPEYTHLHFLYMLCFYVPVIARYVSLPRRDRPKTSLSRGLICAATVLVSMLAVGFSLDYSGLGRWIAEAGSSPEMQAIATDIAQANPKSLIWLVLIVVVAAPLGEECLFRGLLYNLLKRTSCKIAAAIVSSLVFSLVHLSLVQTLPLFIFALMLTWVYEKTGSLRYCILVHACYNAISVIGIFFFINL